ncbi:MAG: hypothetical protein LBU53_13145 [Zoogloeaceae bacterium]|nr:hypothetical protein [Zoogloeaceae bacterium]
MEKLKHSKLGVASFSTSLFSWIMPLVLVLFSDGYEGLVVFSAFLLWVFGSLLAFITGAVSLFQKNARKILPALTLLVSAYPVFSLFHAIWITIVR